jgi:uncharacterized membrane protein
VALAGSLFDSLLGATVPGDAALPRLQQTNRAAPDPQLRIADAAYIRSQPWLENDAVNLAATLAGSLLAAGIWAFTGSGA